MTKCCSRQRSDITLMSPSGHSMQYEVTDSDFELHWIHCSTFHKHHIFLNFSVSCFCIYLMLLLKARLHTVQGGQYCFARWRLPSSVVVCNTPRLRTCNITHQGPGPKTSFLCPDRRVATGEGWLAQWGRTKFVPSGREKGRKGMRKKRRKGREGWKGNDDTILGSARGSTRRWASSVMSR